MFFHYFFINFTGKSITFSIIYNFDYINIQLIKIDDFLLGFEWFVSRYFLGFEWFVFRLFSDLRI